MKRLLGTVPLLQRRGRGGSAAVSRHILPECIPNRFELVRIAVTSPARDVLCRVYVASVTP